MTGQPLPADVWAVAPLNPSLAAETRALVARLDSAQRLWLSGYLAGSAVPAAPAAAAVPEPVRPLATILYGTQTGNAERLGKRLGEVLAERGIPYSRLDMMDCRPSHLADAQTLLVIVSTQGEG
ncbi:MAG TPA: flavodoxin domain-containing protein, partial [Steroidobacteraceae bacterium]|nr:flavodoxin domain-containing protein [Steroidobacteraceae bacterium]